MCVCVCVCVTIAERSAILLVLANQTDQGDETEGLEREGLERDRPEREGVNTLIIV